MPEIIFPDIEKHLVSYINTRLTELGETGVRVATSKAPADSAQPAREVVIIGNYTGTLDVVRQEATVTIEVYATEYGAASELALLVAAIVVQIPSDPIKRAVVTLGPVRMADAAPLEKRSISVELVVKGSQL